MNKKKWQKISLIIGLVGGVLADGYLRFTTGEEGNLLIHSVVFGGSFLIVAGLLYGFFLLKGK